MTITPLSTTNISLIDTTSMNQIDFALLKKSLDTVQASGAALTSMMEQSVNPSVGANIDIKL